MTTSAFVYGMRNSMLWARVPTMAMFGLSIGLMYGTHALPYETMYLPKMMAYTAFSGVIGLSILPLI